MLAVEHIELTLEENARSAAVQQGYLDVDLTPVEVYQHGPERGDTNTTGDEYRGAVPIVEDEVSVRSVRFNRRAKWEVEQGLLERAAGGLAAKARREAHVRFLG